MASQSPNPRQLGKYLELAQVGFEMVVPIALGVWLDGLLGWIPWLTVVGVILGLTLGLYHIVALTSRPDDAGKPGGSSGVGAP